VGGGARRAPATLSTLRLGEAGELTAI